MQLHVVSGRGVAPHYSTLPRIGSPSNLAFATGGGEQQTQLQQQQQHQQSTNATKFTERGAPEGAASVQPSDVALSPTNQNPTQPSSTNNAVGQTNGTTKTQTAAAAQTTSAVYYAMNIWQGE